MNSVAEQGLANRPANAFKALIIPRHLQRFDEVAALVSRRSQWAGSPIDSPEAMNTDVWLGGSFAPLGGQNLIKAPALRMDELMPRATKSN